MQEEIADGVAGDQSVLGGGVDSTESHVHNRPTRLEFSRGACPLNSNGYDQMDTISGMDESNIG